MDADEDIFPSGYYWIGLTQGIAGGKNASVFHNFVFIKDEKAEF